MCVYQCVSLWIFFLSICIPACLYVIQHSVVLSNTEAAVVVRLCGSKCGTYLLRERKISECKRLKSADFGVLALLTLCVKPVKRYA